MGLCRGEKRYLRQYLLRSDIEQDRSAVVMCNLNHEIIYMNPAAITYYAKGGGEQLIGKSVIRFSDFKGMDNCFWGIAKRIVRSGELSRIDEMIGRKRELFRK
jgi:PAS domain-containing protein